MYVNEQYKKMDTPVNYKPPIHHNAIQQNISKKDDFIRFVNEYKTDSTKLFYSENKVFAIFNYPTKDSADYADSFASMELVYTQEFYELKSSIGARMSQKALIRFLKMMEPYITKLDGAEAYSMDVIEMAENLQAIKRVDSIMRNASNRFSIDAEVKTGKVGMEIPRIISFELAIYRNDLDMLSAIDLELFLEENDGQIVAELVCYNMDRVLQDARERITANILDGINGVPAFMT